MSNIQDSGSIFAVTALKRLSGGGGGGESKTFPRSLKSRAKLASMSNNALSRGKRLRGKTFVLFTLIHLESHFNISNVSRYCFMHYWCQLIYMCIILCSVINFLLLYMYLIFYLVFIILFQLKIHLNYFFCLLIIRCLKFKKIISIFFES